jgi:hypothetical protein
MQVDPTHASYAPPLVGDGLGCAGPTLLRFQMRSSTIAKTAIATIAVKVSGALSRVSIAKNTSTTARSGRPTTGSALRA